MSDKMFNSVIIASDSKGNNKLRFCNDLEKRIEVLKRDGFTIHESMVLPESMTKRKIVDFLMERQHERSCDEDRESVENALEMLKRKNLRETSFDDVRNAILSRKTVSDSTVTV
jgi:hypothetical protein